MVLRACLCVIRKFHYYDWTVVETLSKTCLENANRFDSFIQKHSYKQFISNMLHLIWQWCGAVASVGRGFTLNWSTKENSTRKRNNIPIVLLIIIRTYDSMWPIWNGETAIIHSHCIYMFGSFLESLLRVCVRLKFVCKDCSKKEACHVEIFAIVPFAVCCLLYSKFSGL